MVNIIFGYGFDQSTMDDYRYGPYYNDKPLSGVEFVAPEVYFRAKRCNEKRLAALHKQYMKPGILNVIPSKKTIETIITCAWKNVELSHPLLEGIVYLSQLGTETTTENMSQNASNYISQYIPKIMEKDCAIIKTFLQSD